MLKKIWVGRSAFLFLFFYQCFRIHVELTLEHIFTTHELELLLYFRNNNPIHFENIVWKRKCDI